MSKYRSVGKIKLKLRAMQAWQMSIQGKQDGPPVTRGLDQRIFSSSNYLENEALGLNYAQGLVLGHGDSSMQIGVNNWLPLIATTDVDFEQRYATAKLDVTFGHRHTYLEDAQNVVNSGSTAASIILNTGSSLDFSHELVAVPFSYKTESGESQNGTVIPLGVKALFAQRFAEWLKRVPSLEVEPKLDEPVKIDSATYEVTASLKVKAAPPVFNDVIEMPVWLNTTTLELTTEVKISDFELESSALADVVAHKRALDDHLRDTALNVMRGEAVTPMLSDFKRDNISDTSLNEHLDDVYSGYRKEYDKLAAFTPTEEQKKAFATAYNSAYTGSTTAAKDTAMRKKVMGAGSTAWQTFAGLVNKGTSGLWSAVKEWGPVEIVGGYAGYKAVQSASKSSIPLWMIVSGLGLGALLILK